MHKITDADMIALAALLIPGLRWMTGKGKFITFAVCALMVLGVILVSPGLH